MPVVFLLGSGISIDAGIPGVGAITARVLEPHAPPAWWPRPDQFVPVHALITAVQARVAEAKADRTPNYEEIALAIAQVGDALDREYESIAVLPFAAELQAELGVDAATLADLSRCALDHIQLVVTRELGTGDLAQHGHLNAILRCCDEIDSVDLATLNHDVLLEQALSAREIEFADGFEPEGDEVRAWTDSWDHAHVRLLKLHGSVNWFDVRPIAAPQTPWRAIRYSGSDVEHLSGGLELRTPLPTFLIGTFTKILAYQTGIFPYVHARLLAGLAEATHLIIIGYGFQDKAINSHIIRWMDLHPEKRLIVCHRDPEHARDNARAAVQRWWRTWAATGRLTTIPHHVREVDYHALAEALA